MFNELNCAKVDLEQVKEPGIFETTRRTLDILLDVSRELNSFKMAIDMRLCPEEKRTDDMEPHSFRENVIMLEQLAMGIRSDLNTIVSKFM